MVRSVVSIVLFLSMAGSAVAEFRVPFFEKKEIASRIKEVPDTKIQSVTVDTDRRQVRVKVQTAKMMPAYKAECMLYLYDGDLNLVPELVVWKRSILEGYDPKNPISELATFRFDEVVKPGRYCLVTIFSKGLTSFRSPSGVFFLPEK